ncbi:toll/interleukin-1 receptor domain-containing protein (plasmid) [Phormidium sp. CLA17]|nr:toll/interleukin-1 receptor domain-containing protein [Leptolyngbya sp. Cla-17]
MPAASPADQHTSVLLKQTPTGEATVQPKPDVPSPPTVPVTTTPSINEPIEVFISYSHRDDDLRQELDIHLANLKRQKKIEAWHDRAIEAGEEWEAQIKGNLESARIILLLISPPFMASDYCYDIEMQRSIERHNAGTARVIPIILRPCDWRGSPFSKLQILPKDAKPVTQWSDRDAAFLDVVEGLRQVLNSVKKVTNPREIYTQPVDFEAEPPSGLWHHQEVISVPLPSSDEVEITLPKSLTQQASPANAVTFDVIKIDSIGQQVNLGH